MQTKLYGYFLLGAGSSNSNRRSGYGLDTLGWKKFYEQRVKPLARNGITRIWFHNPHGCRFLPGVETQMQLDQLMRAKEAGLTNLVDGFYETLLLAKKDFQQVVCYYGNPAEEESLFGQISKSNTDPELKSKLWQMYANSSLDPAIAAKVDIGLDASSDLPEKGEFYKLWQSLKARNLRVYLEAAPTLTSPHLFNEPYCITSDFLQRFEAMPAWAETFCPPFEKLTGECVVLSNNHYLNPKDWTSATDWPPKGQTWETAMTPSGGWMVDYLVGQAKKGRSITVGPMDIIKYGLNVKKYFAKFGVTIQ